MYVVVFKAVTLFPDGGDDVNNPIELSVKYSYDDDVLIITDFPVAGCRVSDNGKVLLVWDANLHYRFYNALTYEKINEVTLDEEQWSQTATCAYWPVWESVVRATMDQYGETTPLFELCSLGPNDDISTIFSETEVLLIGGNGVIAKVGLTV